MNIGRVVRENERLLVFCFLIAGTSWAVAQTVPPGRTGFSSGPLLLAEAGQTKATVERLRRQGKDLMGAIDLVNDLHGAVQLRNRLEELLPQIQAKMPANGGVLVAAYVDDVLVGEGSVRTLRSVQIVGSYTSEKEALEDLARPGVKAATGPVLPFQGEPNPRVRTTPRHFWIAAPISMPPLAKPEELAIARERLSRLLEAARQTCEAEGARLDIEWKAIQEENSRLNKNRRLTKPKAPASAKVSEAGEKEIDAWEASQRQAITTDLQAAATAQQAADRERTALAALANELCQEGNTYDQCSIHPEWKASQLRKRQSHEARAAQWDAQAQRRLAAADSRRARLSDGRDARMRDLEIRVRAAERDKEAADALTKDQDTFRDRLSRFNEMEEAVRKLRATVVEIQKVLTRLQPPSK